ncbi:MAG: hydroxyacid dehydrogenase [Desulfobacteraceae bacterium IS3]|nr:MAG: hydroxyacid dehydrogenase [Desulfobacteraceae bacterium IS3]
MNNKDIISEKQVTSSEILLYQTEDGKSRIEVRLENETVWLSQKMLSELFQVTVPTINEHIKNIFKELELNEHSVIRNFRITAADGKSYLTNFYNLDMIIAIGYRVRSHRGTQFRQWATERLREYMIKGFVLDDERLKEGLNFAGDYFDELLERIRDIRASEKRFYQKIRDIYKLAIDYDSQAEETQEFFKIVQNKLHWAITGKTAAELIAERADADKPNMGLTSWKGAKVRKSDVTVAKNYLNEDEIRQLNRIVTMYLDYAEMQAEQRQPVYMKEWKEKLDAFLKFNEKDILRNAGKVSMEIAKNLAVTEYERFDFKRLEYDKDKDDEEFEQIAKQIGSHKKNT